MSIFYFVMKVEFSYSARARVAHGNILHFLLQHYRRPAKLLLCLSHSFHGLALAYGRMNLRVRFGYNELRDTCLIHQNLKPKQKRVVLRYRQVSYTKT